MRTATEQAHAGILPLASRDAGHAITVRVRLSAAQLWLLGLIHIMPVPLPGLDAPAYA